MYQFLPFESTVHRAGVIDLFWSNVPDYFIAAEVADFLTYLSSGHPYFVVQEEESLIPVAAGGYARHGAHIVLTWGMVRRDLHRLGIGRAFTEFRLTEANRDFPGLAVRIDTSQHSAGFYEKLGFTTIETQANHWAPGLDLFRLERRAKVEL